MSKQYIIYRLIKRILTLRTEKNGGISIRIAFVLLTLFLVGLSVYFLLEKQRKTYKINHRKAIEFCEYGFQSYMAELYEKLQDDPTNLTGIPKTEYNDGWYKVDVVTTYENEHLRVFIISTGSKGTQSVTKKESITLLRSEENGETMWIPLKKK